MVWENYYSQYNRENSLHIKYGIAWIAHFIVSRFGLISVLLPLVCYLVSNPLVRVICYKKKRVFQSRFEESYNIPYIFYFLIFFHIYLYFLSLKVFRLLFSFLFTTFHPSAFFRCFLLNLHGTLNQTLYLIHRGRLFHVSCWTI